MKTSNITLLTMSLACAMATAGCSHTTPKEGVTDPGDPPLRQKVSYSGAPLLKQTTGDPSPNEKIGDPPSKEEAVDPSDPPPQEEATDPRDPWESTNRKIYNFNHAFDKAIAKPVAKGYEHITTKPIREGISRIFHNASEPGYAINSVMQGKVEQGILAMFRVMINSTVGIGGIFDVAAKVDIPRKETDFSDTLAVWGVPPGPFLVLPFLGPTTVRDGLGHIPEVGLHPTTYVGLGWYSWPVRGVRVVSTRSDLMPVTDILQNAVDPYIATREAYLQHRDFFLQEDGKTISVPKDSLNPFDYDEDPEDEALLNKDTNPETKTKVKTEAKVEKKA